MSAEFDVPAYLEMEMRCSCDRVVHSAFPCHEHQRLAEVFWCAHATMASIHAQAKIVSRNRREVFGEHDHVQG